MMTARQLAAGGAAAIAVTAIGWALAQITTPAPSHRAHATTTSQCTIYLHPSGLQECR